MLNIIRINLSKSNLIRRCYSTSNLNLNNVQQQQPIGKPKYFALSQFPYPSGNLHMGHVRVYTMSDCIGRLKRMQGYDVIHPMGWDSFGLPAENAAIQKQISPSIWTESNIKSMKEQLKELNLEFDWDRELSTCSKDYYRWTQELFIQLYNKGLAYRKLATVNWDPIDQTVLANEQVDAQGRSWRSNALVEKKDMSQWFFKITAMADRLHDDLDKLPGWSDEIKSMQREWIGRSKGHHLEFSLESNESLKIKVFTTRVETLYGVSFLAISSKHPILKEESIQSQISNDLKLKIKEFQEESSRNELTGVTNDNLLTLNTGINVISPNGKKVNLILSSSVHADYGTGAVMGVPAHNRADYQVAKQLSLPIIPVLQRSIGSSSEEEEQCYDSNLNSLLKSSEEYSNQSIKDVIQSFEERGWVKPTITFRIHDWLISRQRYWGTPIPMIHCENCGVVPVPSKDLPVILPTDIKFTGKGNLLNDLNEWNECECPKCGSSKAKRETDTMDTFVDSSWYYLRFLDSNNENKIFSSDAVNKYMPVDVYVGGIEHAILHLLYSRFITKFLYDQSEIKHVEPFKVLLTQGLVKAPTYRDEITDKPIHPSEIDFADPLKPINKNTGNSIHVTIEKMSKSKLNGLDPKEMIEKYGSDTLKVYILFKAPPENSLEWDTEGIEGCRKWLKRVEQLIQNFVNTPIDTTTSNNNNVNLDEKELKNIEYETNSTIVKVTESIEKYSFNTGISSLMSLSNFLSKVSNDCKINSIEYFKSLRTLVLLLTPFAPISSQTHWNDLLNYYQENKEYFEKKITSESMKDDIQATCGSFKNGIVTKQSWPNPLNKYLERESVVLVVQFDGKTRGIIDLPADISEKSDIESFVRNSSKFTNRFKKSNSYEKIFLGSTKSGYSINFTN